MLVAGITAYWSRYLLPRVDYQSAQWAISTEVQSLAALLGIMLVGVTILWSQAAGEEARLIGLLPKYYELLRTGGHPAHKGPPVVERLRLDYLGKIKARSLPQEVFPYKHSKYREHRDLFLDLCRLSELVHEYYGIRGIRNSVENDLKEVGFGEDEIVDRVLVRWYDLKSDTVEFLELVTDIFHAANSTFYLQIESGTNLVDRIWEFTLLQHTEVSLKRIEQFRKFRGIWFRLGFGVYMLAIVLGLATASVITGLDSWRPLFVASLLLGLAAVLFTIVFVHVLLRSE